jgi:hypothetical protein
MNAWRYPLGRLWTEKEIARRRSNQELANEASLSKNAMAASFHGGKAATFFKNVIEKLVGK